jgi:DeoR family transcriptional regulator, suf operon transcriptional repressor
MAFPLPQPQESSGPSGYRGTRAALLNQLKKADGLTTKQLAARLGASLNNIRHHLKELEQQGLVQYERQHRGVGAPTFAYSLTPAGSALFPRRYEAVLDHVLGNLVQHAGRAGATALLESRYSSLAQSLEGELAGASPAHRLESLAKLLSAEGFMAEVALNGSTGTLIEHNCAIQSVAERFPEICAAEARLLSQVLGAEVQRERHILNGCSACEYRIRFGGAGTTVNAAGPAQEPAPGSSVEENS